MMKTILAILLTASCGFNSFAQYQFNEQTGLSDEEYKIWSEIWCSFDAHLDNVNLKIIQAETFPMIISLEKKSKFTPKIQDYYTNTKLPDATNDLIKDFNAKNDKSYLLERKFVGCKNYVLISKIELLNIFEGSNDDWKEFETKYPKSYGYVRFSRIGLSPDKKQAVIFTKYSCGSLCNSGDFYFFVKEDDGWVEKVKSNISVS